MKQAPKKRVDPYFQDVPWEIVHDNRGQVIGEVYTYREPDRQPRKRRRKKK